MILFAGIMSFFYTYCTTKIDVAASVVIIVIIAMPFNGVVFLWNYWKRIYILIPPEKVKRKTYPHFYFKLKS